MTAYPFKDKEKRQKFPGIVLNHVIYLQSLAERHLVNELKGGHLQNFVSLPGINWTGYFQIYT